MKPISVVFVSCCLVLSLSGCISPSPEIGGLISQSLSQSSSVPHADHYEYKGPFQFSLAGAQK